MQIRCLEWCARRRIDVGLKPLPYGCARGYFKATGLRGRQHAAWLVRQARALRRTGLNARGVVRAAASSGRRRMPGAGRPHKAPGLREELFEWFIRVRGTRGTRMPVSALAAAARNLRRSMMAAALRLKRRVPFFFPSNHFRLVAALAARLPGEPAPSQSTMESSSACSTRACGVHLAKSYSRAAFVSVSFRIRPGD